MNRYSRGVFCVLLCCAHSLSGQQPAPAPTPDTQPQHVAPPSANLSANELETE